MQHSTRLIIGLMIALYAAGCGQKPEPGAARPGSDKPVKVRSAIARLDEVPAFREAVGTVEAVLACTVSSKVMGTVGEVRVKEGQPVRKDQVLAVLTQQQISADYQRSLSSLDEARKARDASEAALRVAEANDRLLESTLNRYRKLAEGESVSTQELDEIKARAASAKGALSQAGSMAEASRQRVGIAEAGLSAATATRDDMTLKAPYDGVITRKMTEPGDLAAPGRPLFQLEGGKGYRVVFVLAENQVGTLASGQRLSVVFPTLADRRAEGVVETVMPVSDPASRSVEVKLALPSIPELRSGVFARVVVPGGGSKMIRIPQGALVTRGQLTGVFKVTSDHLIRFRLVRTGRMADGTVEILSGISDGDRYVLAPGPDIMDGLRAEEGA